MMTDTAGRHILSLPEFVAQWQGTKLSERSAAQPHFIDLCQLLGQPTPAAVDPTGAFYTFEKGVEKTTGGDGFADVWLRGHFGWEYKGKHKDLDTAYAQLLNYREDLENPPLLVVCDLDRFRVHTNFTGTAKHVYSFDLADLASGTAIDPRGLTGLDVLRALFTDPERLRPEQTTEQVTEAAAREFAKLAESLRTRGYEASEAAHFLMRLLFCLFAEDIGLLPDDLFTKLAEHTRTRPSEFSRRLSTLFAAMAKGGSFGFDDIAYFNGRLFADDQALELTTGDLGVLLDACRLDWASVEPAIFGTLFERSLDPAKRAQLGAHYTSRHDILLIVEPVLMAPLRREWERVKQEAEPIVENIRAGKGRQQTRYQQELERLLLAFSDRLASVRILDPACGSGNFLYVALKQLLDLEKEVVTFAATSGTSGFFPQVSPEQLHGIEINEYAHELAQVVIWIGYIQWLRDNGFGTPAEPILKPLQSVEQKDAILGRAPSGRLVMPEWPDTDVIVGNPPFLGGKRLRTELGDIYVNELFALYEHRVPREADLVAYWFERAREMIDTGSCWRAGLLATQSIRAGANRRVLYRIKETGDIFYAQADRPWVLDGADVRVSIIGFDRGEETCHLLNTNTDDPVDVALVRAREVLSINANLTAGVDVGSAARLAENLGMCFQGPVKVGSFEITDEVARAMLAQPNPNGLRNSLVVKPWMNATDVTRRPRNMWIIDFGDMGLDEASLFEAPFEHVRRYVKPFREGNNDWQRRTYWWRLGRSGGDLKSAKAGKTRVVVTPRVARHRLFVWAGMDLVPDSRLFAFARDDAYFFGIVHSHLHEVWSLATSSRHGVGNDPTYNNTTCFETFPFPWPLGHEQTDDGQAYLIAQAAVDLVEKRDRWLNPEGLSGTELKTRTLTRLYNERPTWLDLAHHKLDTAVLDAYGWPHNLNNEQILERLLALNLERASAGSSHVASDD